MGTTSYVPPPEDIKAILEASNQFESDIIRVVYHTAARSGEIRHMSFKDVDIKNNSLTLWTQKRKNGNLESDIIEMSNSLKQILTRRIKNCSDVCPWVFPSQNGKQISKYTVDNIMPRLCKRAKIKPFGLHAIRHHIAVQLAYKNWPLIKIQKFLRHKRTTTTDIYLRSIVNMKIDGVSILDDIEQNMRGKNNSVIVL